MITNAEFNTQTKFSMEVKVNNNPVDYVELFKAISEKIVDKDGNIYYHSHFYFKVTENEEIFEICKFGDLPKDVKELTPQYELLKIAEAFIENCDTIVAGEVYTESGYRTSDVDTAIKIAAGFNID